MQGQGYTDLLAAARPPDVETAARAPPRVFHGSAQLRRQILHAEAAEAAEFGNRSVRQRGGGGAFFRVLDRHAKGGELVY